MQHDFFFFRRFEHHTMDVFIVFDTFFYTNTNIFVCGQTCGLAIFVDNLAPIIIYFELLAGMVFISPDFSSIKRKQITLVAC